MTWEDFLNLGVSGDPGTMTPSQIIDLITSGDIPLSIWIQQIENPVITLVSQKQTIQAIKAFREKFGTSLRYSKMFVDVLVDGVRHPGTGNLGAHSVELLDVSVAMVSEEVLSKIEAAEDALRTALRAARGNDKAFCALSGIHMQIVEVWRELIGVAN